MLSNTRVTEMSVRMRGFTEYIRLSEALRIILSNIRPLGSELADYYQSLGRVLAEDIISKVNVPPFDRSAMDGYAVRASDTFGASAQKPVELCIVGSVAIGAAPRIAVGKGEAVKIMTGAVIPKGADASVMVESTKATGSSLNVFAPVTPGKNVSALGEDIRAGQLALKRGQVLRPQDIGLLAAIGQLRAKVVRRPTVGILSTGGELREPGQKLAPAKVTNANSYSLAAYVQRCGGIPKVLGIVPDKPGVTRASLKRAALNDMVLVSGGSSVGERDLVPDAISDIGELLFHGVAIRPGSPTGFGLIKGKPVFALAGFSVAALVSFDLLARPALLTMQCLPPDYGRHCVQARLTRKISSSLGRVEIIRVGLKRERGRLLAEPIGIAGSSILTSITQSDGFIRVPENVEGLEKGHEVEVELYS